MSSRRAPSVALLVVFLFLAAAAAAQIPVEVGKKAPDFTLHDSTGKVFQLSKFRGKQPVVLEFFRSGDW